MQTLDSAWHIVTVFLMLDELAFISDSLSLGSPKGSSWEIVSIRSLFGKGFQQAVWGGGKVGQKREDGAMIGTVVTVWTRGTQLTWGSLSGYHEDTSG